MQFECLVLSLQRIMSFTRPGTWKDSICYAKSANEFVFFTPVFFSVQILSILTNYQA